MRDDTSHGHRSSPVRDAINYFGIYLYPPGQAREPGGEVSAETVRIYRNGNTAGAPVAEPGSTLIPGTGLLPVKREENGPSQSA